MTDATVPLGLRLRLTHGILQVLADDAGVDVLHIKGPAIDPVLLSPDGSARRMSSDADVLVRPEHVERFLDAVKRAGWVQKTRFMDGSAFGHAVNIYHPQVGNADIHRTIPGLKDGAFDVLWAGRKPSDLGHAGCSVPSHTGQRLILALHGARSGPGHRDRELGWYSLSDSDRHDVRELAGECGADIVIALLEDSLDEFSGDPEYLLWKHYGSGETSRLSEWRARWRAATTIKAKVDVVHSFLFMSNAVVENELGHEPTLKEKLRRHGSRIVHLWREVTHRGN